jgi:hypothetical protein
MENFLNIRHKINLSFKEGSLYWLVLCFPALFFTTKGWTNGISFLLFFISVYYICRNLEHYLSGRSKVFWIHVFVLSLPFFAEVIAQIGRGSILPRALDGPSRFLIGTSLYIFLSRAEFATKLPLQIARGTIVGLLILFIYSFDHQYFWGMRLATKISDPNTLAVYTVIFWGLSLLALKTFKTHRVKLLSCHITLFSITAYICYLSQTRTAWIMLVALLLMILIQEFLHKKLILISAIIVMICVGFVTYEYSEIINTRFVSVALDISMWLEGDPYTSVGTRLSLKLMDLTLLQISPWFGFEDGQLPDYATISNSVSNINEEIYLIKKSAGSHSEIFAQLTRKGIILGPLTIMCLFLYPLHFFWSRRRSEIDNLKLIAQIGLMVTLLVFLANFAFETFNLKMTSTFWSIFLAIYFASIRACENKSQSIKKNISALNISHV